MTPRMPITETSLRHAMRDGRYWQSGHPERDDFAAWVTEGFKAMVEDERRGGNGVVFVRAYVRRVKGKPVQVSAPQRGAPAGYEGNSHALLTPVARRGRQPPDDQIPPPGPPMERVPGLSGKEAANDVPHWARGQPPSIGKSPTAYATRLMDNEYGHGNCATTTLAKLTSDGSQSHIAGSARHEFAADASEETRHDCVRAHALFEADRRRCAPNTERHDGKWIGTYTREGYACVATKRLADAIGFADKPDNFRLFTFEVDRTYWSKGFLTGPDGSDVALADDPSGISGNDDGVVEYAGDTARDLERVRTGIDNEALFNPRRQLWS